jgi:hypothetical protein
MGFISDKKPQNARSTLGNTGKLNLSSLKSYFKISNIQSSIYPSVFSFKNGGQIRLILFVPSTISFFNSLL